MRHYLIVANLTLGGENLWNEVRARMEQGPCRFHVLAPATHDPKSGAWSGEEDVAAARARVEHALRRLRDMGAEADGQVGDIRSLDSTLDALRAQSYDEIILSTLPPSVSRWLGMDLPSRLRRTVDVPVTHVIGHAEHAGEAP